MINNKVLIIEDDISVSKMIQEYLEKEGYMAVETFIIFPIVLPFIGLLITYVSISTIKQKDIL